MDLQQRAWELEALLHPSAKRTQRNIFTAKPMTPLSSWIVRSLVWAGLPLCALLSPQHGTDLQRLCQASDRQRVSVYTDSKPHFLPAVISHSLELLNKAVPHVERKTGFSSVHPHPSAPLQNGTKRRVSALLWPGEGKSVPAYTTVNTLLRNHSVVQSPERQSQCRAKSTLSSA